MCTKLKNIYIYNKDALYHPLHISLFLSLTYRPPPPPADCHHHPTTTKSPVVND
ncbi:hypothetical protein Hanom_Chr15g01386651 [Helianthus anomalus]